MQDKGYGTRDNLSHVVFLEDMDDSNRREYIKELYLKDSEKYFEWKEWCMELDQLPDIFGTIDNPLPFDESKL